jgi:hypothetical protein
MVFGPSGRFFFSNIFSGWPNSVLRRQVDAAS